MHNNRKNKEIHQVTHSLMTRETTTAPETTTTTVQVKNNNKKTKAIIMGPNVLHKNALLHSHTHIYIYTHAHAITYLSMAVERW